VDFLIILLKMVCPVFMDVT